MSPQGCVYVCFFVVGLVTQMPMAAAVKDSNALMRRVVKKDPTVSFEPKAAASLSSDGAFHILLRDEQKDSLIEQLRQELMDKNAELEAKDDESKELKAFYEEAGTRMIGRCVRAGNQGKKSTRQMMRMRVLEVLKVTEGIFVTGRVEQGILATSEKVTFLSPHSKRVDRLSSGRVFKIETGSSGHPAVWPGHNDFVTLTIKFDDAKREPRVGDIMVSTEELVIGADARVTSPRSKIYKDECSDKCQSTGVCQKKCQNECTVHGGVYIDNGLMRISGTRYAKAGEFEACKREPTEIVHTQSFRTYADWPCIVLANSGDIPKGIFKEAPSAVRYLANLKLPTQVKPVAVKFLPARQRESCTGNIVHVDHFSKEVVVRLLDGCVVDDVDDDVQTNMPFYGDVMVKQSDEDQRARPTDTQIIPSYK